MNPIDAGIVQSVLARKAAGESGPAIAKSLGLSTQSVYNILHRNGAAVRPTRAWKRTTPDVRAEACAAVEAGETPRLVAERYGTTENSIKTWCQKAGVHLRTMDEFNASRHLMDTEREDAAIAAYVAGDAAAAVEEDFGLPARYLYNVMERRGVPRREKTDACRHYALREDAFDLPITPEAAYWAGLLMADGYVSMPEHGKSQVIALQLADEEPVRDFAVFLGTDRPVRVVPPTDHSRGSWIVSVRSQRLADALAVIGVAPRKTNRERAGDAIAGSVDFWRGVWDGDGCYRACPQAFLCGSASLLRQFLQFAPSAGVRGSWRIHTAVGDGIMILTLNTEAAHRWCVACQGATPGMARKQMEIADYIARGGLQRKRPPVSEGPLSGSL